MQLPKGYYAVQSDFEKAPKDRFVYRGVTYEVCEGVNLFASLKEAQKYATEVPVAVPNGLPYTSFAAPVILFSSGRHAVDFISIRRSVFLLGEGAGISPNLPAENPLEPPPPNPARAAGESVLCESYWYDNMTVSAPEVQILVVDGFSFDYVSFRDTRTAGRAYIAFRNILHLSPCGNTLYHFSAPAPGSTLDREVLLQNIRAVGVDALGYGGNFTVGALGIKMVIDGYPMGAEIPYREGMTLALRLGDFYPPAWREGTAYELRLFTDRRLAYASRYNGKHPQAVALAVERRAFYRAEVFDLTHGYPIAIGNPIWLM